MNIDHGAVFYTEIFREKGLYEMLLDNVGHQIIKT